MGFDLAGHMHTFSCKQNRRWSHALKPVALAALYAKYETEYSRSTASPFLRLRNLLVFDEQRLGLGERGVETLRGVHCFCRRMVTRLATRKKKLAAEMFGNQRRECCLQGRSFVVHVIASSPLLVPPLVKTRIWAASPREQSCGGEYSALPKEGGIVHECCVIIWLGLVLNLCPARFSRRQICPTWTLLSRRLGSTFSDWFPTLGIKLGWSISGKAAVCGAGKKPAGLGAVFVCLLISDK